MRIDFDATTNALIFNLGEGAPDDLAVAGLAATLDIGARGRLLALTVELPSGDEAEIVIDPADDPLSRAARVRVTATLDAGGGLRRVTLPRVGQGYEITYPSGNQ